jgi:hypothetical protein
VISFFVVADLVETKWRPRFCGGLLLRYWLYSSDRGTQERTTGKMGRCEKKITQKRVLIWRNMKLRLLPQQKKNVLTDFSPV